MDGRIFIIVELERKASDDLMLSGLVACLVITTALLAISDWNVFPFYTHINGTNIWRNTCTEATREICSLVLFVYPTRSHETRSLRQTQAKYKSRNSSPSPFTWWHTGKVKGSEGNISAMNCSNFSCRLWPNCGFNQNWLYPSAYTWSSVIIVSVVVHPFSLALSFPVNSVHVPIRPRVNFLSLLNFLWSVLLCAVYLFLLIQNK